jgi:hypothetical protein
MIKGDPIEPSRLELYYKQITMKYRKNKSNIIEYKQKEIQEKKPIACTLTPYKEEYGGSSSQWGRERSSKWTEGSETGAEKIGRNGSRDPFLQFCYI